MKKKQTPQIKLKRVYDKPSKSDGYRVFVDRLWPRGLSKEKASLNEWAKDLAPTDRLRIGLIMILICGTPSAKNIELS